MNGIGCVLMLAVISFALLAMALYDYKRLVQIWLYMSCVLIIFGVFASFLVYDFNFQLADRNSRERKIEYYSPFELQNFELEVSSNSFLNQVKSC